MSYRPNWIILCPGVTRADLDAWGVDLPDGAIVTEVDAPDYQLPPGIDEMRIRVSYPDLDPTTGDIPAPTR